MTKCIKLFVRDTTALELSRLTACGSNVIAISTNCVIRLLMAEPEINAFLTHLAVKEQVLGVPGCGCRLLASVSRLIRRRLISLPLSGVLS